MILRSFQIAIFCLITLNFGAAGRAQNFDLSSGGQPTITGAVGGSVSGSSDTAQSLTVNINFGELSPSNPNQIVKVIVPIFIRSTLPYQITVAANGTVNPDPRAVQAADAGFGLTNFRSSGNKAQICGTGSHAFVNPFGNDPQTTAAPLPNGRIGYQSSLNNLLTTPIVLRGPQLTQGNGRIKRTDDGYIFNAIFAVTPQFFAPGTGTTTITFNIAAGAASPC